MKVKAARNSVLRKLQKYRAISKSDDSYRDRTWPLPKVTTVTEIVPHHFQKWRQLQRSYLTTSTSDDSYRDRTWPLPKATTVTEIVLDHFQKWRQLQRSYLTTSKSEDSYRDRTWPLPKVTDSYRDRTWPLPKVTTVTQIVLDHFQKWRQLQRSYLTTSKSDDSYRDRTWPLPKVTTVTEIVLQRTPKVTTVTEIIAKSKLSCETSFKNESPKSIFDDSHTGQARGKPAASPRQTEPAVSRTLLSTSEQRTFPCKTQHFASRLSTQIILQVAKMTTVTEIVLHHFQKWRQLQRSYLTTSKSDDSYRDRTSPLPKVTTVTEIVLDHFQKWRQLQRSYFSVLQKWRQSQRSSLNRSFRARLPSKTNLQSQFLTTVTRGKPEASPRQARGRLNPPFRGPYFRRRSSALFLAKHSISRAGYLPKSYFKLQKWQQSQRSYFTTSKSDDSYRDRTSPLPKVTTVTEIVPHHFQKWRQLQRSLPKRSFRALALAILCFSYPLL